MITMEKYAVLPANLKYFWSHGMATGYIYIYSQAENLCLRSL